MIFAKYSCGCVAIVGHEKDDIPICVDPCDTDAYENRRFSFFKRPDLMTKDFTWLSYENESSLISKLSNLIHDGQSLEEVRFLLREPMNRIKPSKDALP